MSKTKQENTPSWYVMVNGHKMGQGFTKAQAEDFANKARAFPGANVKIRFKSE